MVSQGGDNNDHYATLDLSGLTKLRSQRESNLCRRHRRHHHLRALRPNGIMRLADTNYIQTAAGATQPGVLVEIIPQLILTSEAPSSFSWAAIISFTRMPSLWGPEDYGPNPVSDRLTGGTATLRGSAGGNGQGENY